MQHLCLTFLRACDKLLLELWWKVIQIRSCRSRARNMERRQTKNEHNERGEELLMSKLRGSDWTRSNFLVQDCLLEPSTIWGRRQLLYNKRTKVCKSNWKLYYRRVNSGPKTKTPSYVGGISSEVLKSCFEAKFCLPIKPFACKGRIISDVITHKTNRRNMLTRLFLGEFPIRGWDRSGRYCIICATC